MVSVLNGAAETNSGKSDTLKIPRMMNRCDV